MTKGEEDAYLLNSELLRFEDRWRSQWPTMVMVMMSELVGTSDEGNRQMWLEEEDDGEICSVGPSTAEISSVGISMAGGTKRRGGDVLWCDVGGQTVRDFEDEELELKAEILRLDVIRGKTVRFSGASSVTVTAERRRRWRSKSPEGFGGDAATKQLVRSIERRRTVISYSS